MKNKNTFRFKIVEETSGTLSDDLKTVKKNSTYYLYIKVSWFLGGWLQIKPKDHEDDWLDIPFESIEAAKNRAHEYAENIIEDMRREEAKKRLKKELKTTTKVIVNFEIDINAK